MEKSKMDLSEFADDHQTKEVDNERHNDETRRGWHGRAGSRRGRPGRPGDHKASPTRGRNSCGSSSNIPRRSSRALRWRIREYFTNAKALKRLSEAAEWESPSIPNATEYIVFTTEFQRVADDLLKKAKDKNIDGATLAYRSHDDELRELPQVRPRDDEVSLAGSVVQNGTKSSSTLSTAGKAVAVSCERGPYARCQGRPNRSLVFRLMGRLPLSVVPTRSALHQRLCNFEPPWPSR